MPLAMSLKPTPKSWIDAIDAYVPGRGKADPGVRLIKLSSNENPLGPSPRAIAAMAEAAAGAHRYPDGASLALRDAIAAHHGIEADRVVCGTGSDELLQCLALAYAGPGDEVLFSARSFMVYPIAARRAGATPVEAADRDYGFDVDAVLAAVTPRTRLVYLANPNNPTGTMIAGEALHRLHSGLPADVLLVVDAAYAEYVDANDYDDGIALARTAANVVTTRTFSKLYGLAAERIGWAYGPAEVIATLDKVRGPFNVTSAGQAGAIAALADSEWTAHCRRENARLRSAFVQEVTALDNAGLRAVPSAANFVLVEFPQEGRHTAAKANAFLAERGVLVRWLPGLGLSHALRVSIGSDDDMQRTVAALREFLA
jgi:histidinol-phosphate aminotransferase